MILEGCTIRPIYPLTVVERVHIMERERVGREKAINRNSYALYARPERVYVEVNFQGKNRAPSTQNGGVLLTSRCSNI